MKLAATALVALLTFSGTASAQTATALESRVDRLEREMRAVQRKVFPGGAGQTVEPQITPPTVDDAAIGSSSPVADLTQRVAALEAQVQTLTGQVEQTQYRLRQVEDAFGAYKRTTDARLKALEDAASTPPAGTTAANTPPPEQTRPTTRPATPPAQPAATTPPAATGDRAQRLAAIQRPSTGDAAEDGYVYGYRLWQAQFYPEARREFEQVVARFPTHRRASYAQNLLGRAYLDSGAPSLAAVAFYDNYKNNPSGERAPDSLYYLAQALTQLRKPSSEICKVYTELMQLYGDRISAEMRAGVAEGRARNNCR